MKTTLERILVIAVLVAVSFALSGEARADSDYKWTGFHFGLNAGAGFAGENKTELFPITANFVPAFTAGAIAKPHYSTHGLVAGGQAGYDHVFGKLFLAGLETDFQYANIHRSAQEQVLLSVLEQTDIEQSLKFLGTVRARVGVLALPCLLAYGTGGFAYGDTSMQAMITDLSFPELYTTGNQSEMKTGWTAGGGIEWGFAKNVSMKVEYLYYDLGKSDTQTLLPVVSPAGFALSGATFETSGHIVRTGLNFRF